MPRRALLASLALHAAVVFLIVKWLAVRAGSADPEAGATFAAAGGRLVEIAEAAPNVAVLLPSPPDFSPPDPVLEPTAAPVEEPTALGVPGTEPAALSAQTAPVKTAASAPKRSRAARPGRGASAPGPGLTRGAGAGAGGPGYVPPGFRLRYKPPYPEAARAQRLEGTVLLLVSLDARGHVTAATLQRTCGHTVLDRAALRAVRSWLFEPARQNGTAIAAQVEIPVRFRFAARA